MEEEEFVIVTYTIIRSIISSKKCVLCTRPIQVHPHPEQWAADDAAPGEQLGALRPTQGSYPSRGPFCRSRDSNPPPWATSPTLHTPGHGRPWKDEALHGFACHPFAGAMLIFSTSIKFLYMCRHDQLEREIRRYGVSTGPAFNFGDRKQLSGLLKWLLGLKRFSMYWYDVWRYDASMPRVKYRYL